MPIKSFALGGAAIAGLIGAALCSPAVAYTHHPSTPAERQQTDALNAQQLAGTAGEAAPGEQHAMAATSGAGTTMSLDAVSNPPQTLANASVETASGQAVGAVQKVVVGSDGKAKSVDVTLLGGVSKTVSIDATQLSYDQSRNVVVAQMGEDQIRALPASPQG